jgi:hypothetical protein
MDRVERVRQDAAATNVLHAAAPLCLLASASFWLVLYWSILAPASVLSQQALIATLMGLVYAVVLPVLWSILIPNTPAGMLLQQTRLKTWGFVFVIGASGFLTYHAGSLLYVWWYSQPNVRDSGQTMFMTVACVIAFVGIPALAWVQATPEQWAEQVRQWHQVERLKAQQAADIAILKSKLLWAQQKAAVGMANLLPGEREELVGVMRGLFMGMNETIDSIAGAFRGVADIEFALRQSTEDDTYRVFDTVADELERHAAAVAIPTPVTPHSDAVQRDAQRNEPTALTLAPAPTSRSEAVQTVPTAAPTSRSYDPGSSEISTDEAYRLARETLPPAWMAQDLAVVLNIEEATARKLVTEWRRAGRISGQGLMRGRYNFTEGGAA